MRAVCNSRPSGFDERTTTNTPPSARTAMSRNGSSAARPKIHMRGDSIDSQRRRRREITFGVSGAGGVDVAALAIEQHQHFATARQRVSSSTAFMPALPKRSKNADCGLSSEIRKSAASSTRLPNSNAPSGVLGRLQDLSSAADGSMPTHSGLCSAIFCCNRAAKVDMSGYLYQRRAIVLLSLGYYSLRAVRRRAPGIRARGT